MDRRAAGAPESECASRALEFIAEHVEGNLLAAHQEILKLGLLHAEGSLALEQIREAVLSVARYDIDKVASRAAGGRPGRCARLLEGLRGEGEPPPLILWALASRNPYAGEPAHRGRPGTSAGRRPENRAGVRRSAPAGRKTTASRLRSSQLKAADCRPRIIDRMIKGPPGEVWDEFLLLMLKLRRHP